MCFLFFLLVFGIVKKDNLGNVGLNFILIVLNVIVV